MCAVLPLPTAWAPCLHVLAPADGLAHPEVHFGVVAGLQGNLRGGWFEVCHGGRLGGAKRYTLRGQRRWMAEAGGGLGDHI